MCSRWFRFVWPLLLTGLVACTGAPAATPIPPMGFPPAADTSALTASPTPALLPPEPPPPGAEREFRTDFSRHTVPYAEILSGGPPKDGIPALDRPRFVDVAAANEWLHDQEPVILVRVGDDARAYPLQILMWHEIVNDTVGDLPLAVTYCPLCNTGIAFIRRVDEQVLDFGTTGRLRFSNLIMYDRQTESWWQQADGEAIAGELAGRRLSFYPALLVAWADFKAAYPHGRVLSRETGYRRDYGRNPYVGYDAIRTRPFLYEGPETPATLLAMARVLTLDLGGEAVAYPYEVLAREGVVNDTVGGMPVVVFWQAGTASALDDAAVAMGRDVGAAAAFAAELDGRRLTFRREARAIRDVETGSTWDVLGRAIAGELNGRQLTPVVGINHFWFSWAAFRPDTRVYGE